MQMQEEKHNKLSTVLKLSNSLHLNFINLIFSQKNSNNPQMIKIGQSLRFQLV
jgi:hypothetical protein